MGKVDTPVATATYESTFKLVTATLHEHEIPHACMGSLALWALGGPSPNHQQDLDFAIAPEDVSAAKECLGAAGLHIEQPPESWLFKAWSGLPGAPGSALVDLIHQPAGLVVTREQLGRCEVRSLLAMPVAVLSATDLLVTKIWALTEQVADLTSLLQFARSLREQVDHAQLRDRVCDTPFGAAFLILIEGLGLVPPIGHAPIPTAPIRGSALPASRPPVPEPEPEPSMLARLEQSVAEDMRGASLDISVSTGDGHIILRGEAANDHHRAELGQVVQELVPDRVVDNQIQVRSFAPPREVEAIR